MNLPAPSRPVIFETTQRILGFLSSTVYNALQAGLLLCQVRDERLFIHYADHTQTFDEYLKEIRVGRSTAYNCMGIYERFWSALESRSGEPLPEYTRLVKALPLVKSKEDADTWVENAITLPADAYEDALREAKGKTPSDGCAHSERETWSRCSGCGKFLKTL